MDNWDLLTDSLKEFHITLTNEQFHQFQNYYELMIEWNSFMNLTAITEMDEVIMKHFVDSVSLIQAVPDLAKKGYSLIDIGTGAGFPGIPLKIVFPDLKITLLDSLNKRIKFLNQVILDLSLIIFQHFMVELKIWHSKRNTGNIMISVYHVRLQISLLCRSIVFLL